MPATPRAPTRPLDQRAEIETPEQMWDRFGEYADAFLDKLAAVPVDIEPRFTTAEQLLST